MNLNVPSAVVCALVLAAPLCADARMYQWVSPSSSVPQLSGEPPPWYRSNHGGPRVRVFENGNLVDDTAITLLASQRQELRTAAFREAEERRRVDVLNRLERAARAEELRRAEEKRLAEVKARQEREALATATVAEAAPAEKGGKSAPKEVSVADSTVEQLKAIIAEFDRRGGGSRASR